MKLHRNAKMTPHTRALLIRRICRLRWTVVATAEAAGISVRTAHGKAERFIQTLQREWAYGKPYRISALRTRALAPWLRYYNTRRPHTAIGYQPPAAHLPRAAQ